MNVHVSLERVADSTLGIAWSNHFPDVVGRRSVVLRVGGDGNLWLQVPRLHEAGIALLLTLVGETCRSRGRGPNMTPVWIHFSRCTALT